MKDSTRKAYSILQKTFGADRALLLSEVADATENAIPIGIAALDRWVLGTGGFPRGQFFELYGKEKAGKTSLVLHMIAAAQRADVVPIILDPKAATAADRTRATRIGVCGEDAVLLPIRTSEEALIEVRDVIVSISGEGVQLAFFWDDMGLSATKGNEAPTKAKKKAKASPPIAEKAKVMWQFVRALSGLCYEHQAAMVIVNHLTSVISTGGFSGPTYTTIGGGSTRAAARIRLKLTRTGWLEKSNVKYGQTVKVITEANAFSTPFRSALLHLDFVDGYSNSLSTLLNAEDAGLVTKERGKYKDKSWRRGTKAKSADQWTDAELRSLEDSMWSGGSGVSDVIVRRNLASDEEPDEDEEAYVDELEDEDGVDYSV